MEVAVDYAWKDVLPPNVSEWTALSEKLLLPEWTDKIFAHHGNLLPELLASKIPLRRPSAQIYALCALARLLPFASYMKSQVLDLVDALSPYFQVGSNLCQDERSLLSVLLALFRLLSYDRDAFPGLEKPTFYTSLFSHASLSVRYLATQCFCSVMHFADAFSENLVHKVVGDRPIPGWWEGQEIDYRWLRLYEEQRWKALEQAILVARQSRADATPTARRVFALADLSSSTACVGDTLLPRGGPLEVTKTTFVATDTAMSNLQHLGMALVEQKPILVIGEAGAGKTSLISEGARLLNKLSSMITLYLNEQTDAKNLLGLYTSSADGASFQWQPGVLTKAMQQGRWVLIEDIDRAPEEVLGVLRPILENGELLLPMRREKIRPKAGFRIIATIRTTTGRGTNFRHSWITNQRIWGTVTTKSLDASEIGVLLRQRFPKLRPLLSDILSAHHQVVQTWKENSVLRKAPSRLPSLRDLIKWCCRIDKGAGEGRHLIENQPMPKSFQHDIFMDGVDCYGVHLSGKAEFDAIVSSLAQALNITYSEVQHLTHNNVPEIKNDKTSFRLGRTVLQKMTKSQNTKDGTQVTFAFTNSVRRTMQSVAAALACSEPLLLVGETGIGKTASVQQLSHIIGQRLTVINLSQQSEATDLLGGLKPVTTRSLVNPLREQFDELFEDTFSAKRNEKFLRAVEQAFVKEKWSHLLRLWQEGVKQADALYKLDHNETTDEDPARAVKRRKLTDKRESLKPRWQAFNDNIRQLKAHVDASADHSHVFSFLESRLVQAVRNGEWLLLDEINLASSDTLDHVVSLFQSGDGPRPSITLSEAGQVEKITAHPQFRVFAAMNPATDTGKKDLAPALRSLFTELYVHPGDQNVQDLVAIIKVHIENIPGFAAHTATDCAEAYLEVKKLNQEHKLTDGAGVVPHFSIRSLVRCLLYAKQYHATYGLTRALYEGFAMSFFTVLSRESEMLVMPVVQSHLLSNVKNMKSFFAQRPRPPTGDGFIPFEHYFVQKGPEGPDLQSHYIITPSVQRNLINLARAASMRRFPILLQGPTSAGKTSMVEYLAKVSGNKFVRINNHEHTDLQEYLGSYAPGPDGKLEYRDGVLVHALRNGHWVVLDELNLAPSDVLEALNRLLDDNRELFIPETQEVVRPHRNFMLFATQNPAGLYGGRKTLSRAFRNRFLEIHFDDIPENELEVILKERAQFPPSFCAQIVAVYKKLSLQRQSSRLFDQRNSFATLRDLFRWAGRKADSREQLAYDGFMLLGERVRDPVERQIVKSTIEETMRLKIKEDVLYGPAQLPLDDQSIVWTRAMRRLFVLVAQALKKNEPVLLVGETGCGKTQICQTIAHAFKKTLSIYNAHTNTETGDLIGSQRPIRQRTEMVTNLLQDFRALESIGFLHPSEDRSVDQLIELFESLDTSTIDPELTSRLRKTIGEYRSLFTWNDGSVVAAMKQGHHFLLDEISLADDSVLERLNSLLEPSRTIVLSEKGSEDNLVIAQEGFQFLATMNPGGDYGKRELSAALRNRLTEIWVPPLSEDVDILPIVKSKLRDANGLHAEAMLKFAKWFQDRFQSSEESVTSLRSLLAWAEFIVKNAHLPLHLSLVHGAAMVYIDSLGADPARLTMSGAYNVEAARMESLNYLQSLLQLDLSTIYHAVPQLDVTASALVVGPFSLSKVSEIPKEGPDLVFDAPTTAKNTMRIVRALQMNRPILLEGNPGVGKTAIVTALAATLGKSFTRINLSDQTDLMDLFGADAPAEDESLGRFSWRDGPLLQAMHTGGWVLLDEMNLASQSVLEGLNSCLDHRHEVYVAELGRSFICHPDFTLFGAQNPHSQGGGRKGLPKSFVNRFTVVYADPFTQEDLQHICSRKHRDFSEEQISIVVANVAKLSAAFAESSTFVQGGPWELNLRDVDRWFALAAKFPALPISYPMATLVDQRLRTGAQRTLAHQAFGATVDIFAKCLYNNLSSEVFHVGFAFLQRDKSYQHSTGTGRTIVVEHLAHAQPVMTAIDQRWPVILVGPSGSGKTSLIRNLAGLSGARLEEISLSVETDTMDLLGGFEQYDSTREVLEAQQFCLDLVRTQILCLTDQQDSQAVFQQAVQIYEQIRNDPQDLANLEKAFSISSRPDPETDKWTRRIADLRKVEHTSSPRFVWNDGILVEAVQKGYWLVLDNANLCNASVLDRLNSLLEPDAHLVISEQHNSLEDARTIRPHPNFRIFLTMDPKYGDLSRAMRNRSLEVFMSSEHVETQMSQALSYPESSAVYRARRSPEQSLIDNSRMTDPTTTELVPFVQSLSLGDIDRELPFMKRSLTEDTFTSKGLMARIAHFYDQLLQRTASRSDHLALNPLVNEPLVITNLSPHQEAVRITRLFALHFQLQLLQHLTLDLVTSKQLVPNKQMEKTAKLLDRSRSQLCEEIETVLTSNATEVSIRGFTSIVVFLRDFLAAFIQANLSFELTQVYLEIGNDLLARLNDPDHGVSIALDGLLRPLSTDYTLKTGKSLQRMWEIWKPATASSLSQLQNQLQWEELVARFDQCSMSLAKPVRDIATIRLQLTKACARSLNDQGSPEQFQTLSHAVDDIALSKDSFARQDGGFAHIFSELVSKLVLSGTLRQGLRLQQLTLLARRPAPVLHEASINGFNFMLERLAICYDYHCSGMTQGKGSKSNLFQQLCHTNEQPLARLPHVEEELEYMATEICSQMPQLLRDPAESIENIAKVLLAGVFLTHKDLLHVDVLKTWKGPRVIDVHALAQVQTWVNPKSRDNGYLQDICATYIRPAIKLLASESSVSSATAGLALSLICLAALVLMVPDRLIDPALYPTVVAERQTRRFQELKTDIAAQKKFQLRSTGQDTSMLIRLLEQDLQDLSRTPIIFPGVVRPEKSGLAKVQEQFSNIVRLILSGNLPNVFTTSQECDPTALSEKDLGELRQLVHTVTRFVNRLSGLDRCYDDLVQPVEWLLKGLAFGVTYVVEANEEDVDNSLCTASSCPLLDLSSRESPPGVRHGTKPGSASRVSTDTGAPISPPAFHSRDETFMSLEQLAVEKSVCFVKTLVSTFDIDAVTNVTEAFYEEWKTALSKDQASAEYKSKYYAYRGMDDDEADVDEAELSAMFPKFEEEEGPEGQAEELPAYEPRSTAIKLARIHSRLLGQSKDAFDLRQHILQLMNTTGVSRFGRTILPGKEIMAGALLLLEEKMNSLTADTKSVDTLNVYTDADIAESQKLVKLVQRIYSRFVEISDRWPEHAVPHEVLQVCDELLRFKLNDPIVKLLTKIEKLQDVTSQWQSVASSEWSAAVLLDELALLIISWRRLELLSWSRLLDLESQKFEENALSWYFIAYEAVVHNSCKLMDQPSDVEKYCQELTKTLDEYLRTASLGEYSTRLQLLEVLSNTLSMIAREDRNLWPILFSVTLTLQHHRRYEPAISKTLEDGRKGLEKALKEVILLASWKDTNVSALRDSARRSHHKLFKIVRKYRALLGQPIGSFSSTNDPTTSLLTEILPLQAPNQDIQKLQSAAVHCQTVIPGWDAKPDRLKRPTGATLSMRHVYESKQKLDVQIQLAGMREGLVASIKELRSQTPSTLTDDNTSLVRHLRERKRRLLADSIKDLTQMGIRRNLAVPELAKQATTTAVLATLEDFQVEDASNISSTRHAAFHDLLDQMPQVREVLTKHSDDLTDGEVRRCVGLLEGLLLVTIEQRQGLASTSKSVHKLDTALDLVRSLSSIETLDIRHSPTGFEGDVRELCRRLAWLPHILQTSCQILHFQSKQSGSDFDGLIADFESFTLRFVGLNDRLNAFAKVPPGLCSNHNIKVMQDAQDVLDQFATSLQHWEAELPSVEYLTRQITPWTTNLHLDLASANGKVHESLREVDTELQDVADSIFVAMQRFTTADGRRGSSTEDPKWYTNRNAHLSHSFRALAPSAIAASLDQALGKLAHLDAEHLPAAMSLLIVYSPIFEQFFTICKHLHETQAAIYEETCRLALTLSKSFNELASQGFCTPTEPAKDESQAGKLEAGTGLGGGDGAEDISKDVGEDEDLSELAQTTDGEKPDGDIETSKDAVDMADEELKGQDGDAGEAGSGDEEDEPSENGEQEIGEEAGSVDDLDPSAVDEKMWDDMKEEAEKEMKGDKEKGKKSEEQTAAENGQEGDGDELEAQDNMAEAGDDKDEEGDAGARPEAENVDPHLQEQQALDLPEELQLNGEEEAKDGDISDDAMDELSDVEKVEDDVLPDQLDDNKDIDQALEEQANGENQDTANQEPTEEDENAEGNLANEDEIDEDQPVDKEDGDDLRDRADKMDYEVDQAADGKGGAADAAQDTIDQNQEMQGQNETEQSSADQPTATTRPPENQADGETGTGTVEQGVGRDGEREKRSHDALKKVSDVLERYYQRREIFSASEDHGQEQTNDDVDMADADFEDVEGEDEGNAQALGAAGPDQTQDLDPSKAIEDDEMPIDDDAKLTDVDETEAQQPESLNERMSRLRAGEASETKPGNSAIIGEQDNRRDADGEMDQDVEEEDFESHDETLPIQQDTLPPLTDPSEAAQLWATCSTHVHALSLHLTEQLRLILSPTTATKLRGDYRTGKRLNIKRIIPYIASGYKRDKIWMRRSIPSKRNYQIMLAVDDSKSMTEGGADVVACETLAMLCKSLSMLESGELCVVGFGKEEHIRVAHRFGQPFSTNESGPRILQNLSFAQTGTDMRKLIKESIAIFQDARVKASGSQADLWQLMLIISDGMFSDPEDVRRLVRQAMEEKIMIVFVIVDGVNVNAGVEGKGASILEVQRAVLVDGEWKLKRYIEGFPFQYYVIVREVGDLPGVLATALKGWFASIVEG